MRLKEQHENKWLYAAMFFSKILKIPLVGNIEYQIYLCKLEIAEADRLKAKFENIEKIAILVEDSDFYNHNGINWKGITRSAWQYIKRGRKSGGSSISQQCARTNFLTSLTPVWRRKIVEIFLAKWLENALSKEQIIKIYLTTARFDNNIYGFHRACQHFFKSDSKDLSIEQGFILVERLGNIRSYFLAPRVKEIMIRLQKEGILNPIHISNVLKTYADLCESNLIKTQSNFSPKKIISLLS